MRTLDFTVNGQIISYDDGEVTPVANSLNYITAQFTFNDEWDNTVKTSIWRNGDTTYSVLLDLDDKIEGIGWLTEGEWEVSVYGGDLITVNTATVLVQPSGYDSGDVTADPTEQIYNQLVALATETLQIAQGVRDDADNGEFTPDITMTASVDSTVGTPTVTVTQSGTALEPTYNLAFTGLKGETGNFSSASATIDNSTGTPTVSVTLGGDVDNRSINFDFEHLKGEQGEKGDTGDVNFCTFNVDENGNLIATFSDDYSGVYFQLVDNYLEVVFP